MMQMEIYIFLNISNETCQNGHFIGHYNKLPLVVWIQKMFKMLLVITTNMHYPILNKKLG